MSVGSSTGQKKSPFKKPSQDQGKGNNTKEVKDQVKSKLQAKGVGKEITFPRGAQEKVATVAAQKAKNNRDKPAEKTPVTPTAKINTNTNIIEADRRQTGGKKPAPAPKNNSPQPQPSSSLSSLTSSTSPVGTCQTFADWSAAQTDAPPTVTRYLQDEIKPKVDQLTESNNSYSYLSGLYDQALSVAVAFDTPDEVDEACAILRESVDTSLGLVQTTQSSKDEREKKEVSRTAQEKETVAKERKPGLGKKWGLYNKNLQYKNTNVFSQYVPADTYTIAAALKSQSILDAVFHKGKAFWVGIPGSFELASYAGKSEMRYHFSAAGAKSLMEDYLLCASGDFANDNEQEWAGESAHPLYTLWKANELGAYGIGASRLAELAGSVQLIEAYDPQGKKIVLDK